MKYVLANPKKYGLHEAVKIADANVGMSAGFKTIPLYALGFINNNKELKMPVVDYSKLKLTDYKYIEQGVSCRSDSLLIFA